jgi:uncharacterized membrane protein YphA (DoxX/SURF4 family)
MVQECARAQVFASACKDEVEQVAGIAPRAPAVALAMVFVTMAGVNVLLGVLVRTAQVCL